VTKNRRCLSALIVFLICSVVSAQVNCYKPGTVGYYGFFGSDYADVTPSIGGPWKDGWKTQAQGANITQVRDTTAQGIIDGLLAAQARGQKAIVSLDVYIFSGMQPLPDWAARMDVLFLGGLDPATGQFTTGIFYAQPNYQLYQSTVAAFYLQDEPYLNGYEYGVPAQTILNNANMVVSRLRSKYGAGPANTPIAQFYSIPELDPDNFLPGYIPSNWTNIWGRHAIVIPSGVNWVGFDCYNSWYSCGWGPTTLPINSGVVTDASGAPGSGLPARDSWYKRLKLLTNQSGEHFFPNGPLRSIIAPVATTGSGYAPDEATLQSWAANYSYMAQDDQAVVGILGWIWGKFTYANLSAGGLGAMSSTTQQVFEQFASCVLPSPWNRWNHVMNGRFDHGTSLWGFNSSAYSSQGLRNNVDGSTYLTQWTVGPGWSYTYQDITGLKSGIYTLSAYLRHGPNFTYVELGAKNCNGIGYQQADATVVGDQAWTKVSTQVTVSGPTCQIYVYSQTDGASDHTDIDDITLQ
jgi:hypothetical protein